MDIYYTKELTDLGLPPEKISAVQQYMRQFAMDAMHDTSIQRELLDFQEPPKKVVFAGLVYYNHGLGNQSKKLENVVAASVEEARTLAGQEADKLLGDGKWLEVTIRPIGPAK